MPLHCWCWCCISVMSFTACSTTDYRMTSTLPLLTYNNIPPPPLQLFVHLCPMLWLWSSSLLLCFSPRFDFRAFRWVQTMVFAIEEINRDSSLLPGVRLGYRIVDSCDYIHTGLRGALSLVNVSSGQKGTDSRCPGGTPVSAVIGLASSSPTRAVAHTLGPFRIPLVSFSRRQTEQTVCESGINLHSSK